MDFQGEAQSGFRVSDIGLRIGTILNDRYRICEYMSLGNMTIMYVGHDEVLNKNVLIKELAPVTMVNRDLDGRSIVPKNYWCKEMLEKLKESFDNEIEILKILSASEYGLVGCIPEYQYHFSENETKYLVMTFYEGRDLQKRISNREELKFRTIARDLVEIVSKVHKAGIVHRDIKFSNIFIKNDGKMVLLDFGSACIIEKESETARYVSKGISPPELYEEKATTRWVDNFSIGAVLYQMLTGVRPVKYNSNSEMYILDIGEYVNIPWQLALVIMKLLELKPEKRLKNLWVIKMLL